MKENKNMSETKYLIYSLEDDEDISHIINVSLTKAGFEVASFNLSQKYLDALAVRKPDLSILDLMLPDIQGMDVLKKVRGQKIYDQMPIIILSAKNMLMDKVDGLDNGADDYVEKPFNILELISRINARLRNGKKEDTLSFGDLLLDKKRHQCFKNGLQLDLTNSEYEIIQLLLSKISYPVSREDICSALYGTEVAIETRAIDMHVAALRKKIGDSDGKVIRTVYGIGYQIG